MNIRKENLDLLKIAKTIFGDIVIDAYVCCTEYDCYTYEENVKNLNDSYYGDSDTSLINYDEIHLVFTNGKTVGFTNSEWAEIFTPNLTYYKNI